MQAGVVPSNSAADASNNAGAFQTLIDWLTSKTNGGTITSGSFHPNYTNPIITLNEPIILKPKVHFDFDRSVRFRATSAMPAMVDTVVGAANRLRGQSILGGTWDAGRLAERCFNFREFEDINFGGDNMELRAASRSALSMGDPARSANNFGFCPSRLKIINSNAAYGPDAVAGIEILHGISDCNFDRLLIVGYPRGVVGPLFISRAHNIHVWSYPDTQGPCLVSFACDGGNNVFSALQVDNPYQAAFEIVGGDNYRFIGCTSTYAFEDVTDPNAPGDLAITVFKNTAQINKLEIIGAYGNDRPTTRFAGLIDIYPADTQVAGTLRYGPAHTNRNPRSVRFNPTSPPDFIWQVAVSGGAQLYCGQHLPMAASCSSALQPSLRCCCHARPPCRACARRELDGEHHNQCALGNPSSRGPPDVQFHSRCDRGTVHQLGVDLYRRADNRRAVKQQACRFICV